MCTGISANPHEIFLITRYSFRFFRSWSPVPSNAPGIFSLSCFPPRILQRKQISEGLFLIYWGLFKKLFIADNLDDFLFFLGSKGTAGAEEGGALVLVSAYGYLLQLYCDFSAYSDIARGVAKLFGIEIMDNFNAPFFASNIQEVWARWHISLTSWIRDYLYYPLALFRIGKRHIPPKAVIVITFVIMGLWHGAAWNYILWGLYHGLALAVYASIAPWIKRRRFSSAPRLLRILIRAFSVTFTFHISVIGILLFQAESLEQILVWFSCLLTRFSIPPGTMELFSLVILYTLPLWIFDFLLYRYKSLERLFQFPAVARYCFLYITFFLLMLYGSKTRSSFIYFQF